MKHTLFLNPPSYEGFDGGAGSRYQARREIRSFWYPTWLAQPAAMVPGSRLIDAPPDGLSVDQVAPLARDYELAVLHTSTPSFGNDARFAARLKEENPKIEIGMVGAHVGVLPMQSLNGAPAVDWVALGEFDYACADIAGGKPLHEVPGIAYRDNGQIRLTAPRPTIEDMDALPNVIDVYKRDLTIENYFIGYLQHPYVSLYTGRGCRSKCTFCLWPQTLGGHRYRVRSADSVEAEMAAAKKYFPQVREFFFDDDTFTDDLPRAEEIARRLGKLGIRWSCNAKANVPRKTLEIMRENGLRLLLVGYESGNQQILNNIKKGTRLDIAREFTRDCQGTGNHDSRHLYPGIAGRDAGNDQGNHPLCLRHRAGDDPSFAGGALSGHGALPAGAGAGLAADSDRRTGGYAWRADCRAEFSDSLFHSDFQFGGGVLPEVLLPPAKDLFAGGRHGAQPRSDEAAVARGRGVFPLPARPQEDGPGSSGGHGQRHNLDAALRIQLLPIWTSSLPRPT